MVPTKMLILRDAAGEDRRHGQRPEPPHLTIQPRQPERGRRPGAADALPPHRPELRHPADNGGERHPDGGFFRALASPEQQRHQHRDIGNVRITGAKAAAKNLPRLLRMAPYAAISDMQAR